MSTSGPEPQGEAWQHPQRHISSKVPMCLNEPPTNMRHPLETSWYAKEKKKAVQGLKYLLLTTQVRGGALRLIKAVIFSLNIEFVAFYTLNVHVHGSLQSLWGLVKENRVPVYSPFGHRAYFLLTCEFWLLLKNVQRLRSNDLWGLMAVDLEDSLVWLSCRGCSAFEQIQGSWSSSVLHISWCFFKPVRFNILFKSFNS